jgi:CD63 antigen
MASFRFSGMKFVKYITLILNVIFMLTGILLMAFGGYAMSKGVPGLSSTTIAAGVIVLGVLVFIVSFFGCLGSLRENRILLIIYFSCVLLFILIEFSLGIAAYAKRDQIPTIINENWTKLYNSDRNAIEDIEITFQCCGYFNQSDRAVPPYDQLDNRTCVSWYPDYAGAACEQAIDAFVEKSYGVAGGAAIAIAIIQIVCLLFSCFMFVKIPKQRDDEVLLDEATR